MLLEDLLKAINFQGETVKNDNNDICIKRKEMDKSLYKVKQRLIYHGIIIATPTLTLKLKQ